MYEHCYWSKGLQFSCTQCGACCQGQPGTIYFSPAEIDALIDYLKADRSTLLSTHFVPFRDSYSARDDLENGRCIFYQNGCTIYEARPAQCRAYPFWRCILKSQRQWKAHAKECPGMNQGKLFSADEICAIAGDSTI